MPGPPPKPTAIKAAEGNPGKRPLNTTDLSLAPEEPEPPVWLDEEGRIVWDSVVPPMMEIGILRLTDQLQLASLCDAVSIMIDARRQMGKLPPDKRLLVSTPTRGAAQNPLIGIVNRQKAIIHRLCSEFGLTPAARARLLAGDIVAPAAPDRLTLDQIIDGASGESRFAEPVN